ncbi:MAG: GntR family transcriptional regulator [Eubacterium sp.]|nr:GntR family transcriptional regulator [Eubacterium sp.]
MEIDENSLTPLFIQIAEWIESEILLGNIEEGECIPSTNQFASIYGINPATARKGFDLLTEKGIIFKKRGIGMFVADGAKEKLREKAKTNLIEERISLLVDDAKKLGISKSELIEIIRKFESWGDR